MNTPTVVPQPSLHDRPVLPEAHNFVVQAAGSEVSEWLRQGDEHMEKEAWSAAIGAYMQAAAAHLRATATAPRLSEALWRRGVYWRDARGDPRRAARAFTRAIQFASDVPAATRALKSRGRLHQNRGRTAEAIADFTQAIRLDTADAEAYCWRGEIYSDQQRHADAIADYAEGLRIAGEACSCRWDLFFGRGLARAKSKDYEGAIEDFSAALQLHATGNGYTNRGLAFARLGHYDQALADYDRALSLEPDAVQTLINRAYAFKGSGDTSRAIEEFSRVLSDDPDEVQAIRGRIGCYLEQKQYEVVIADATALCELSDTEVSWSLCYRGDAHQALGSFELAIADYSDALRHDPTETYALVERARVWDKLREPEKALADLTEAVQIDPKDRWAHNGLAWELATTFEARFRDGVRAVEHATAACELAKWEAASPIDTLAAAYAECGEFARAAEMQRLAIELAKPEDKDEYCARRLLYLRGKPYRQS